VKLFDAKLDVSKLIFKDKKPENNSTPSSPSK